VSIALLEQAAEALGELVQEVVFVGGATVELWITDPAAPAVRPTLDVDVVLILSTLGEFESFTARLRDRGFREDQESGVICRWRSPGGLVVDAMPARADILGFKNRWQAAAIPHAAERALPSGVSIRAASPPYLLAMKLEAFRSRGRDDLLGSRDFGDIIALIDGRAELIDEVLAAPTDVRDYLVEEFRRLLAMPRLIDGLAGAVPPDTASQDRVEAIILPAIGRLSEARG
jgi:predicted nucleotidyltransferase